MYVNFQLILRSPVSINSLTKMIGRAQNLSGKKQNFVGTECKLIVGATIHPTDQHEGGTTSDIQLTSYTLKRQYNKSQPVSTQSATNSPEGTGTISKATDTIIPWINILKASLLVGDDNWNTLTSTILTGALIHYVLFIHNYKILKQKSFLNGWYSSILEHSKYFSIFL